LHKSTYIEKKIKPDIMVGEGRVIPSQAGQLQPVGTLK